MLPSVPCKPLIKSTLMPTPKTVRPSHRAVSNTQRVIRSPNAVAPSLVSRFISSRASITPPGRTLHFGFMLSSAPIAFPHGARLNHITFAPTIRLRRSDWQPSNTASLGRHQPCRCRLPTSHHFDCDCSSRNFLSAAVCNIRGRTPPLRAVGYDRPARHGDANFLGFPSLLLHCVSSRGSSPPILCDSSRFSAAVSRRLGQVRPRRVDCNHAHRLRPTTRLCHNRLPTPINRKCLPGYPLNKHWRCFLMCQLRLNSTVTVAEPLGP